MILYFPYCKVTLTKAPLFKMDFRSIKSLFILKRGALVRVYLQYGVYRIIKPIFILKREALGRVALQ
jgi:hypothetical protein